MTQPDWSGAHRHIDAGAAILRKLDDELIAEAERAEKLGRLTRSGDAVTAEELGRRFPAIRGRVS